MLIPWQLRSLSGGTGPEAVYNEEGADLDLESQQQNRNVVGSDSIQQEAAM